MTKIKTRYYSNFSTPEITKLPASTKSMITKDKISKIVPHSEITEVVLIHCNIANNDYQQYLKVLYTLVPNKSLGELLDISRKNFIYLKTFDSEFSYIEVWFSDKNINL